MTNISHMCGRKIDLNSQSSLELHNQQKTFKATHYVTPAVLVSTAFQNPKRTFRFKMLHEHYVDNVYVSRWRLLLFPKYLPLPQLAR